MPATHTVAALLAAPGRVTPFTPPARAPGVPVPLPRRAMTPWSGSGRIAGTVKVRGTPDFPVARKVRLFRELDAVCVGETWSNPLTGAYRFDGVDPAQRYTVLAYDYTNTFRGTLATYVLPEVVA